MASFGLFRRTGAAKFTVDRIDLNVWALPSVANRELFYVDIGVRLTLGEKSGTNRPIAFLIGMPFAALNSAIRDLVPVLVNDHSLCALVFGASDLSIEVKNNAGWKDGTWIEDGEKLDPTGTMISDQMLFVALERGKCVEVERSKRGDLSLWEVGAGDREIESGTSVYLRFRFATRRPGSIWGWQSSIGRSAHAISDLRVSEFRDKPALDNAPNYSTDVFDVGRVNGFVILSSALKAGRVSPQPKYVRVLENYSWENYLGRRLGRKGERFLITYWTRNAVTQGSPFRTFLEVERRRPTAARAVLIATLVLIVAMCVTQPLWLLQASPAGQVTAYAWRLSLPVISGLGFLAILRFAWTQIAKTQNHLNRLRGLFERVDAWRFRLPKK